MKRWLIFITSVGFLISGCGVRLHRSASVPKADRLAAQQRQLVKLTDPVEKSRTYINIANLELDLAVDAAQAGEQERMTGLLRDYDSAIQGSRDSLVQSPRKLKPDPFRDLEIALRTHVRLLRSLCDSLTLEQRDPITTVLQDATAMREQILRLLFPKVVTASR